ncbi:MAG TPA: aspartyl protease family protein [Dongiaceae bacterium]|nr:aspartyl protease family protein [Dongiaceae bacterium]
MTVCALLGLVLLAAPAPVAVLPFTDNGKLVSLPVSAGGSPARPFTLDSGASASVIDSAAAAALRMRAAGSKLGSGAGAGRVRFVLYRDVALAAGAARWTAPVMYGVSLRGAGTSRQEDGLLGYDLFARYVVDIDYAAHRLSLYEPSGFRYAGGGAAIPITIEKHVPHVAVTIKVRGRPAQVRRLLIDSGSEDMVDDAIIATSTAPKQRIATSGLGRSVAAYAGPVEWVRIGPFTLRSLAGTSAGVPLIGSAVLRNFRVTFDYSRRTMYLTKR